MLKFITGVATGWLAARTLPPPGPGTERIQPPTFHEFHILWQRFEKTLKNIKQKLDEGGE